MYANQIVDFSISQLLYNVHVFLCLLDNKTKLKCFYTNARSIVNKRNELELYIMEERPDIIAITETWAVESIEDSELKIEGYTMIRRDRILGEKTRGGGVLLYIIESVDVIVRDDIVNSNILECAWCEIVITR